MSTTSTNPAERQHYDAPAGYTAANAASHCGETERLHVAVLKGLAFLPPNEPAAVTALTVEEHVREIILL
jgi:hypothetical protein